MRTLLIALQEIFSLLLALEFGYILYIDLATWSIYRLVALVILAIAWSNLGSRVSFLRKQHATIDMLNTRSLRAVQTGVPEILGPRFSTDTTAYLVALRQVFRKRGGSLR